MAAAPELRKEAERVHALPAYHPQVAAPRILHRARHRTCRRAAAVLEGRTSVREESRIDRRQEHSTSLSEMACSIAATKSVD